MKCHWNAIFSLQMLEESEHRRIDLLSTFLLYPVTTARKDDLAEVGDELLKRATAIFFLTYLSSGVYLKRHKSSRGTKTRRRE